MRSHSTSLTTEQILTAIKDGVYEAFSERLDADIYPFSFQDICTFLAKGVTDAFLDDADDSLSPHVKPKSQRKTISRLIRMAVWEKTDGHCIYCGDRMNPFAKFHVDHLHPLSDGGSDEIENLFPACQSCNNSKHAKSLEEFRANQGIDLFWFEREGIEL